jgi:AcrR family transcriptional regulator
MTDRTDTPSRLVAAAERLFAEGGEPATSLRAVARLAHANPAAVHYHFGGRDELLRAVLQRHLRPLAERRLRLLAEADLGGQADLTVARIVEALVRPDLELLAKLRKHRVEIARLIGRDLLADAPADPAVERALPRLAAALPEVDPAELGVRLALVRVLVAGLFAAAPAPGGPGPLAAVDVDDQVRRMVTFVAAGLVAPSTTRGRKRRKHSAAER